MPSSYVKKVIDAEKPYIWKMENIQGIKQNIQDIKQETSTKILLPLSITQQIGKQRSAKEKNPPISNENLHEKQKKTR